MIDYIELLIKKYPELCSEKSNIMSIVNMIVDVKKNDGKILICGNGGSASDSDHISGELMKGFILKREPKGNDFDNLKKEFGENAKKFQYGIGAISLPSLSAPLSAYINDVDPSLMYAQLVFALANKNDLVLGLSTSGNSINVVNAIKAANAMGIKTCSLTGRDGGILAKISNVSVIAPANETYLIQEYHLPIYHAICAQVEEILFSE